MDTIAGIEGGGTRFRARIEAGDGVCLEQLEIPTRAPEETLAPLAHLIARHAPRSLGIACFGPLDTASGRLLGTPKDRWAGVDLVAGLVGARGIPWRCETDVTAAALAERARGAARGCDDVLYLTVGTGIGAGILVRGEPLRGVLHPEAGHLRIPRRPGDPFKGSCPFHGDCWEGLASGAALAARAGRPAEEIPATDPLWRELARDLALGIQGLALTLAPERIVLGGGVGLRTGLVEEVRTEVAQLLGGYLPLERTGPVDRWIVPAEFGAEAGLEGALLLARGFASDRS